MLQQTQQSWLLKYKRLLKNNNRISPIRLTLVRMRGLEPPRAKLTGS